MVGPLALAAIPAGATIFAALLTLAGIMFRNKFVILIAMMAILYAVFPILPTGLKVLSIFVLFIWLLNQGKGK